MPILTLIIICEILFWVFAVLGVFFRSITKMPKLGAFFLILIPIDDFLLIIFNIVSLLIGEPFNYSHSLSGLYLGITLAFGETIIKWVDNKINKVKTNKKKDYKYEMFYFKKWVLAVFIYLVVMAIFYIILYLKGKPYNTFEALPGFAIVTVIWYMTGPLWVKK
ncbi:hypothetical protein J6TS1_06710 [Siminovitchia terrae]|uniref:Uncharacterized protein n=1 Tax=Siminovitchia terrae TaxID=1914933 RepID=A0A429XBG3_SIMTE|nr:hypothetical protein [Siminovitchia terrae]RST60682.1 hypothetical protein D5F11_004835 [Siminovitchia terrae]GIN94801.1 hypothetical protein J6TS1_06710 [Siminovitchia terrae]